MSSPPVPRIKPPALRPGDTVGIVALASNVKLTELEAGCEGLRRAGYKPFYFDSILEQDLYFAGSVQRRARELQDMFVREGVRAIVCARGGYGSNYLLEALDWETVKAHPKILVGYSDLTTLLTYLSDTLGFVTFHGPMVAKDWAREDGVDLPSWQAALTGASTWEPDLDAGSGATGLVEGSGEGILYGGCLSILVASLGTPYEIHTEGTILFLEDVAAKPYQIDRIAHATETGRQAKWGARNCVRRDAGLRSDYEPGIHIGRSRPADCRRLGSAGGVWRAVGPRDCAEHHATDWREGQIEDT